MSAQAFDMDLQDMIIGTVNVTKDVQCAGGGEGGEHKVAGWGGGEMKYDIWGH